MDHATKSRTTTALLRGLSDPKDESAWRELLERCGPILRAVARGMGVSPADLDDVVQTTLLVFVESWRRGQYDRERGRLRTFLITILRSRVIDLRRRLWNQTAVADCQPLEQVPQLEQTERHWMTVRRARIIESALDQLRREGVEERSLEAFELYALRRTDVNEVAARLGISRECVYDAKYRLSRRLQSIMARLDELYEDI